MATNIFSTYSTGENRVTASILAVVQSLSLSRAERLLGELLEQPEFELVRFQNQPSGDGLGVPDAIVLSSCRLLVETKIKPNAIKSDEQLKRHLKKLNSSNERTRSMLVLTPDQKRPAIFDTIDDPLLCWASFARLDQAIDDLLKPSEVVSEREAFLLRELQAMLAREKLVPSDTDVVVVAARHAWPEYEKYGAYVCQPDRAFKAVSRMAFYSKNQIYRSVPRILQTHDNLEFNVGLHEGDVGLVVDGMLADGIRIEGQRYKVMLLSKPDASDTLQLDAPVVNDLATADGRTTAFTMGQRYVSLADLRKAKKTSDLSKA